MFNCRRIKVNIRKLGDWSPANRLGVANKLARLGEPKWQEWIKGNMDDFARLGKSGDPEAAIPLLSMVFDAHFVDVDLDTRGWEKAGEVAEEALMNLKAPGVYEILHSALRKNNPVAARALGNLGDSRAVEPLLKALRKRDKAMRAAAARALGNFRDPRVTQALLKARKDKDANVRSAAVGAIGKCGESRAFDLLAEDLFKNDDVVCAAAAEALGELGDSRAIELLRKALSIKEEDVKPTSVDKDVPFLKAINDPAITDMSTLPTPNAFITIAAALAKLREPVGYDIIIKGLLYGDFSEGLAAAEALGKLGDARAVEPLVQTLQMKEEKGVAEKLSNVASLEGVAYCIENRLALWRRAAANALAELRDSTAVEPLRKALNDNDESIQSACSEALGKLDAAAFTDRKRDEVESAPEEPASTIKASIFQVIGLCLMAYAMFLILNPLFVWEAIQAWEETRCEIISSEVVEMGSGDSIEYDVAIRYQYERAGQTYTGDKYARDWKSSYWKARHEDAVERCPQGRSTVCYVNPAEPGEALLKPYTLSQAITKIFGGGLLFLIGVVVLRTGLYASWDAATKRTREAAMRVIYWFLLNLGWIACTAAMFVREGFFSAGYCVALLFFLFCFFYHVLAYFDLVRPRGMVDLLYYFAVKGA
ncbi:HEAT repeat domain-containing protein [Candidatus Hydrogenedentota bacterium]